MSPSAEREKQYRTQGYIDAWQLATVMKSTYDRVRHWASMGCPHVRCSSLVNAKALYHPEKVVDWYYVTNVKAEKTKKLAVAKSVERYNDLERSIRLKDHSNIVNFVKKKLRATAHKVRVISYLVNESGIYLSGDMHLDVSSKIEFKFFIHKGDLCSLPMKTNR